MDWRRVCSLLGRDETWKHLVRALVRLHRRCSVLLFASGKLFIHAGTELVWGLKEQVEISSAPFKSRTPLAYIEALITSCTKHDIYIYISLSLDYSAPPVAAASQLVLFYSVAFRQLGLASTNDRTGREFINTALAFKNEPLMQCFNACHSLAEELLERNNYMDSKIYVIINASGTAPC
jgi:hypothetical protein